MRDRNGRSNVILALVAASLMAPAPATRSADKDRHDAGLICNDVREAGFLGGEWTLVRHVHSDGTVVRHREGDIGNSHFLLRFEGKTVVQEYDFGDPSLEITWAVMLAPSANPKRIDLTMNEASSSVVPAQWKGKVRRGIYQLEGNRLLLCLAEIDSNARPRAFESGRGREVYELKRVKK